MKRCNVVVLQYLVGEPKLVGKGCLFQWKGQSSARWSLTGSQRHVSAVILGGHEAAQCESQGVSASAQNACRPFVRAKKGKYDKRSKEKEKNKKSSDASSEFLEHRSSPSSKSEAKSDTHRDSDTQANRSYKDEEGLLDDVHGDAYLLQGDHESQEDDDKIQHPAGQFHALEIRFP